MLNKRLTAALTLLCLAIPGIARAETKPPFFEFLSMIRNESDSERLGVYADALLQRRNGSLGDDWYECLYVTREEAFRALTAAVSTGVLRPDQLAKLQSRLEKDKKTSLGDSVERERIRDLLKFAQLPPDEQALTCDATHGVQRGGIAAKVTKYLFDSKELLKFVDGKTAKPRAITRYANGPIVAGGSCRQLFEGREAKALDTVYGQAVDQIHQNSVGGAGQAQ
ncbi:MAG: hypothetical protein NDJ90_05765 [Oligoflexia bacterium]|nr:hypothetical protein [Oligoflexia bacterium]